MIRRHATGFRLLLMAGDALFAVSLLVLLSVWRFGADWAVWWRQIVPIPEAFLGLYAVSWVLVMTMNGLYRPRARWSIRAEAADIGRATIVMALLTLSVLFFFHLPDVSRLLLLVLFPVQALMTLASRLLLRVALERYRRQGRNLRYVLVLGAGTRAQQFAAKLESHRELGLRIAGFLHDRPFESLPTPWRRLGGLNDLETVLHSRVIDEVAICLPFSQWDKIDAITHLCEEEGKIVRIPMDVLDHAVTAGRVEDLDGTPVFSLVSGPDRALALAAKRLIDIAAAGVGLIIVSPILAVTALAVRLGDGGPILFRQRRVGLHGRPFDMIKLRSMTVDAEDRLPELKTRNEIAGQAFKLSADPRVTRVGRFLRRTSLDELPQLWNVLWGEMSLVGPRPLPIRDYDQLLPWHRKRYLVLPGMTGLWQVSGRIDLSFDELVRLDFYYIENWSLWLDISILAKTLPAVLARRGAY